MRLVQCADDHTRTKLDGADLTDAGLRELYAYPAGPWLRLNAITSLDGAATVDGLSGQLGSANDGRIFAVLRSLADAVVVGAGTVEKEGYVPLSQGTLVIVSGSLSLTPTATVTAANTLVATTTQAPADRRARLRAAGVHLLDAGTDSIDPGQLLAQLHARGLHKLLSEGGAHWNGTLLAAGLVDEVALTVAPLLTGGDGPGIIAGVSTQQRLRCAHILSDTDSYLYQRWVRPRPPVQ